MKRKSVESNHFLVTEHGIQTVLELANTQDYYRVFTIKLHDGDEISLTYEIAKGILLIRKSLSEANREKMNRMTLLELLHIYDQAIECKILKPSSLKVSPCPTQ